LSGYCLGMTCLSIAMDDVIVYTVCITKMSVQCLGVVNERRLRGVVHEIVGIEGLKRYFQQAGMAMKAFLTLEHSGS